MNLEAWIDVGGTFTDCLVRTTSGEVLRTKILSSSRVPVSVEPMSATECRSNHLQHDCLNFWAGAELAGFDSSGQQLVSTAILSSKSAGILQLAARVDWTSISRFEVQPNCEAPVLAVRRLLQIPLGQKLPELTVRLGTTRGTNALLTRMGAKVALFVTDPFDEMLVIGDQTRPDLFALAIHKPNGLTHVTRNIVERLNADGSVLHPLDLIQARQQLELAQQLGCSSAAISLLHGYRNPAHELQVESLALDCGYEHVSVSHRLASVVEYVARTQTTVLDAYLSPIVRQYLKQLCDEFGGVGRVNLLVMTSAGGLIDWRDYSGKDCILSGPAGGVVALSSLRDELKLPIIGLDMGGTSTDVCRVGEQQELQYESTKAGIRILTPTLPIETVAAGGGSICWFDGVSLRVGPQSAGAFPGPACYGRGGPLTITDLNVVSGRVPASQFPFPLDIQAAWNRVDQLCQEIANTLGNWSGLQLVNGLRRLANEQMADAVRSVSIRQGVDPRQHALVGFGGAAGQHICEIAQALGIGQIIDHADAGLLSAVGMGLARRRLDTVLPIYQPIDQVNFSILEKQAVLRAGELAKNLVISGLKHFAVGYEYQLELRYQGTDSTLTIPVDFVSPQDPSMNDSRCTHAEAVFASLHQQRFGYQRPGRTIELVAVRISVLTVEHRNMAWLESAKSTPASVSVETFQLPSQSGSDPPPNMGVEGSYKAIDRERMPADQCMKGPLIVLNAGSTLVIERGWQARRCSRGMLSLEKVAEDDAAAFRGIQSDQEPFDPVLRDCFAQRLSAIATQMGLVLQQTAVSVNIKQRRDFSCAVFDAAGQLLANAPHVPVHLGSMGVTVRAILQKFPHMQPGDAFLCNDPYCGGSHLPDLTLVQPVFDGRLPRPCFLVANRAHHADIGGLAPGSMSISASHLEQEGVIIPPIQITRGYVPLMAELEQIVQQSPYPPRSWQENVADLYAQQAACNRGYQLLSDYAASIGWNNMRLYSQHLLDAGQLRVEQFLANQLRNFSKLNETNCLHFEDCLEDGTPICVTVSLASACRLRIDFTGTGKVSSTNLNANPSIVTAAVLYVLRCLIADEMPLNEGVLRAVELVIPPSVLNPPSAAVRGLSPAVAAGNVETSQRVVDVLLGALGIAAASQGTMNNVLFGNQSFGFYETICGGSGATNMSPGASAVHTHMTNTRLTDPEVLELRYPVRLLGFCVRHGSGGRGRQPGGDGIIRAYQFLQPVSISLLTSRRRSGPFGMDGGQAGAAGENWLQTNSGTRLQLPSSCQMEVEQGAILTICTPGGGGFGRID